jgi:hypothetical protein
MGEFKFISGIHNDLDRKPFMVMDYNTVGVTTNSGG